MYPCPFAVSYVLPSQVRSYLRSRAGLPSLLAGVGALNQGHHALFSRELLLLNDILPKDADIHDGLQLVDGGDPSRHIGESDVIVPDAPPPARSEPVDAAPTVPVVAGAAPNGVVLPTPQQPMRLEPLPSHLTGRHEPPTGDRNPLPGTGLEAPADDWDEEDDDEIRPVRNEREAQWRAYRAAGF